MLKYVLKRIVAGILCFFIIYSMLFVLIRLLPDKNTFYIYRYPMAEQYIRSLIGIITKFDWGVCTRVGALYLPVTDLIKALLPFTLYTTGIAFMLSLIFGILFGVLTASLRNKTAIGIVEFITLAFAGVPGFILGYVFQYIFGFKLNLIPLIFVGGYDFFSWEMFNSALAPIISLTFAPMAGYMIHLRGALKDSYSSDYMLLTRVKGLTKGQAIWRHAFKNAIPAIFPVFLANIINISFNTILIERAFAVPGIGISYMRSYFRLIRIEKEFEVPIGFGVVPDYNVFLGISMLFIGIAVICGILLDIGYGLLDPRVRVGSKKTGEL